MSSMPYLNLSLTALLPQVEPSLMLTLHNVSTRIYSSGTPSADASPTQDGASPFAPMVHPGAVSSEMSTPIDGHIVDSRGLNSAYFEATTTFEIESRDR